MRKIWAATIFLVAFLLFPAIQANSQGPNDCVLTQGSYFITQIHLTNNYCVSGCCEDYWVCPNQIPRYCHEGECCSTA